MCFLGFFSLSLSIPLYSLTIVATDFSFTPHTCISIHFTLQHFVAQFFFHPVAVTKSFIFFSYFFILFIIIFYLFVEFLWLVLCVLLQLNVKFVVQQLLASVTHFILKACVSVCVGERIKLLQFDCDLFFKGFLFILLPSLLHFFLLFSHKSRTLCSFWSRFSFHILSLQYFILFYFSFCYR